MSLKSCQIDINTLLTAKSVDDKPKADLVYCSIINYEICLHVLRMSGFERFITISLFPNLSVPYQS